MKNKAAQSLGKLGGQATAKKLGSKHFSEAGKKGMAKRWHSKLCIDQDHLISKEYCDKPGLWEHTCLSCGHKSWLQINKEETKDSV